MPRYVHSKSGSYDYLKELWKNASEWLNRNEEYVRSQIPYYESYSSFVDDAQFWEDYKKNTGFSAKYPNRVYGSSGTNFYYSVSGLFRNFKRLYG